MSFLAAAFAVSFFDLSLSIFVGFCILSVLLCIVLFHRAPRISLRIAAAICGAVFLFCFQYTRFDLSSFENQTISLTGHAVDTEQTNANTKFILESAHLNGQTRTFRVMVYMRGEPTWEDGDTVDITASVFAAEKTDAFDSYRFLHDNNLAGTVWASDAVVIETGSPPPMTRFKQLKNMLSDIIRAQVPGEEGALLSAMLFGDTENLSDLTISSFQAAGIAHLFSVSGFHITLFSLFLKRFLQRLHLSRRKSAFFALVGAWSYVLLSGAQIPAVRAGIMATAVLIGELVGRRSDAVNSLFGAGLLIVLLSPWSITSASFLLSFSATFGLCVLSPALMRTVKMILPIKVRVFTTILSSVCASISCSISILFVSAYFFGGISLISPIANLLTIFLVPSSLLLTLISFLPGMDLFTSLASALLRLFCQLVETLSKLPYAFFGFFTPQGEIALVVFGMIFVGFILFLPKLRHHSIRFIFFLLAGITVFLFVSEQNNMQTSMISTFSYSDEMQAVVCAQNGEADVILLGDARDYGTSLLSFLRARNIKAIRSLIFTDPSNSSITPVYFLNQTLGIEYVVLHRENVLYEPLRDAGMQTITFSNNIPRPIFGDLLVLCNESGVVTVKMKKYNVTVSISTDQIVSDAQVQFLRVNNLKTLYTTEEIYSIIMKAPPDFTLSGGTNAFFSDPSITIWIAPSGNISVWR